MTEPQNLKSRGENHFPKLFEPGYIGTLKLANRIVMAPMGTSLTSDTGGVSDSMIRYYEERARGGAGLIIVENSAVEYPRGKGGITQPRIDDDRFIPGLNSLVEAVKQHGPKVAIQLNHGGGKTNRKWSEGIDPIAPSRILYGRANSFPVEMSTEDISIVKERFASAAERAKLAGFDAVELHGANGYLISQFMSPYTNRRTDQYGVNLLGRMQFPVELIESVKKATGQDYPVIFRFSADEFMQGGRTLEDSLPIPPFLEKAGVDCIHVSASASGVDREDRSILSHVEPMSYPQGWRVYLAEAVRKTVKIPVITVGVIREPEFAERIIVEGRADFLAIGRGLIADPEWPKKALAGKVKEINRCISCNEGCTGRRLYRKLSIRCTVNPKAGREGAFLETRHRTKAKKVAIVGGGPAGVEAAIEARRQGHEVTLFEKEDHLGGQMVLASILPHRDKIRWFEEYLLYQIRNSGVEVRLGVEMTSNSLKGLDLDTVIVAAGSSPLLPDVPGINGLNHITGVDLLKNDIKTKEKCVAVVGGGILGCEMALHLGYQGNKVILLEMLPNLAQDMDPISQRDILIKLEEAGVGIKTNARLIGVEKDSLVFQDQQCKDRTFLIDSDLTVLCLGGKSNDSLSLELEGLFPEVYTIGDAKKPRKIIDAIYEGFLVANTI